MLPPDPIPLSDSNQTHLRRLTVGHTVVGLLGLLVGLIPLVLVGVGLAIAGGHLETPPDAPPPPEGLGWKFFGLGLLAFCLIETSAVATLLAVRQLRRQRNHGFCLLVACVLCAYPPFGTALGLYSLMILTRPEVKDAFR